MIFLTSPESTNGAVGHLLLLRPRSNRFGVNRSRFSKQSVLFARPIGRLLILLAICWPRVSHWRSDKRWLQRCFSIDFLVYLLPDTRSVKTGLPLVYCYQRPLRLMSQWQMTCLLLAQKLHQVSIKLPGKCFLHKYTNERCEQRSS